MSSILSDNLREAKTENENRMLREKLGCLLGFPEIFRLQSPTLSPDIV
jgi:hypothetical protein